MSILAIDPGPERSGWVVYQDGRVVRSGIAPNYYLLNVVLARADIIDGVLAVEQVEHYGRGMPAGKSVFDTCIMIGRMVERWGHITGRFDTALLVPRRDVKIELCGSARAKDPNIRQALIDRLGPKGTKKQPGPTFGVSGHVWAALAVAVTAEAKLREAA